MFAYPCQYIVGKTLFKTSHRSFKSKQGLLSFGSQKMDKLKKINWHPFFAPNVQNGLTRIEHSDWLILVDPVGMTSFMQSFTGYVI